jgi:hypothetical protein
VPGKARKKRSFQKRSKIANRSAPLEREILRSCIQYLQYKKIFHWRQNTQGIPLHDGKKWQFRPAAMVGLPDIFILKKPRVIAVECKTLTGKQNDNQKNFEARFIENGGEYHIVRSVDDLMRIV